MSLLFIVTRPDLVPGFQLAGVKAHGPTSEEEANHLISSWLDASETGLLAIDESILSALRGELRERLEGSSNLLCVEIPSFSGLALEASRQERIAEMIRRAIGFHITFKGQENGQRS